MFLLISSFIIVASVLAGVSLFFLGYQIARVYEESDLYEEGEARRD